MPIPYEFKEKDLPAWVLVNERKSDIDEYKRWIDDDVKKPVSKNPRINELRKKKIDRLKRAIRCMQDSHEERKRFFIRQWRLTPRYYSSP